MPGIEDREYHKVAPVPSTGRPSIYSFRHPLGSDDLGAFFDEWMPLPPNGRVLDAGCGPGAYVPAARARCASLVAVDIAHGRLTLFRGADRVCADVQALPFADGAFDVALAMHMLYHVPDISAGVRELRRVVRRGGVLYAFTNSRDAQHELAELVDRSGCDPAMMGDQRFANETGGALLAMAFDDVQLVELTDTWLEVPDAECVVDEVQRLRYALEPGLRRGVSWDDFVAGVRRGALEVVARDGAFRMSENHGLFTCR